MLFHFRFSQEITKNCRTNCRGSVKYRKCCGGIFQNHTFFLGGGGGISPKRFFNIKMYGKTLPTFRTNHSFFARRLNLGFNAWWLEVFTGLFNFCSSTVQLSFRTATVCTSACLLTLMYFPRYGNILSTCCSLLRTSFNRLSACRPPEVASSCSFTTCRESSFFEMKKSCLMLLQTFFRLISNLTCLTYSFLITSYNVILNGDKSTTRGWTGITWYLPRKYHNKSTETTLTTDIC